MTEGDRAPGHRGGFGEFGGESAGLIDRSFRERIVLVGVTGPREDELDTERHLDELALLVDTAGADAVARVIQRRHAPDPATYLGAGKVEELRGLCEAVDADTVVFDDELSPAQQRNLEKALGRTAIDRTAVILDIFGQNAHSLEGKAQVELAQIRYRLPRLRGRGTQLSRQGGGIGARQGGGETQLEVDRRRLLRRMHKLEEELRAIDRVRRTQARARQRSRLHRVAIVGYTNAGKSTLLNRLTDAGVLVEDRLFATLDATTRRLQLPGGETVLLTDTVGFITKLPTQLVEAFKSTLEVVVDADLLVHVVDGSAPEPDENIAAVDRVLVEIGAADVPQMVVVNKVDLDRDGAKRVVADHPGSVAISARTGEGIDAMLRALADRLRGMAEVTELLVPFERGDVLAALHREGEVLVEEATAEGMRVRARLDAASAGQFRGFVLTGQTLG
jgi:GTP-binding protein HflX